MLHDQPYRADEIYHPQAKNNSDNGNAGRADCFTPQDDFAEVNCDHQQQDT